ncbi:hypothetical protein OROGR_027915 [Orobanche gracilis]
MVKYSLGAAKLALSNVPNGVYDASADKLGHLLRMHFIIHL